MNWLRKKVTSFFRTTEDCDWMIPQGKIDIPNHTYLTVGFKYLEELRSIKWKSFYEKYTSAGGDGFYSAWMNPYLENALNGRTFGDTICKEVMPDCRGFTKNLCYLKQIIEIWSKQNIKLNIINFN